MGHFVLHRCAVVIEQSGHALDEGGHVFLHDDLEEFLFAAEVIVQQGQVDAGLFGDLPRFGSGETFFGKELAAGGFDFFFGGLIDFLRVHASQVDGAKVKSFF